MIDAMGSRKLADGTALTIPIPNSGVQVSEVIAEIMAQPTKGPVLT